MKPVDHLLALSIASLRSLVGAIGALLVRCPNYRLEKQVLPGGRSIRRLLNLGRLRLKPAGLFTSILVTSTVFGAAPRKVVTPEPNARFQALVVGADRVLVYTPGFFPADLKNQELLLAVEGAAQTAQIADLFRFTGEYTSAVETELEGNPITLIFNCLCTGSHMISFVRDRTEVFAMTLHHGTHVRPVRGWKSQDINLTKESSEKIRALLKNSAAATTPPPKQSPRTRHADRDEETSPRQAAHPEEAPRAIPAHGRASASGQK